MLDDIVNRIKQFREKIYQFFPCRRDAAMELVDSLASNTEAKSVVELSLNPLHRRNYCSITRAIDEFYAEASLDAHCAQNQAVGALLSGQCPLLEKRAFRLFAVDCTSNERLFSPTLFDRSPVYT